jgi:hypothetical protein
MRGIEFFFIFRPQNEAMFDDEKLQLAGPIGVIGAIACAQFGAYALAYWPSSPLLWYLNLEVFRPVQYSFVAEKAVALGDLAQTLCVGFPLLALVCIGLMTKLRLPLAIASNMSLLYSALLLYGSYWANCPVEETSLNLNMLFAPSVFFASSILLVSIFSSAISHRAYWRELIS